MSSKISEEKDEWLQSLHERRMQRIIKYEQEERERCNGLKFKIVGILNMFDIIPGFVDPIFICLQDESKEPNAIEKTFYIQVGDDEKDTLSFFKNLDNYEEGIKQKVLEIKDVNSYTEVQIDIHSEPVYAFQYSETDVMFGNYSEMKEFLKEYQTEDGFLKKEIQCFMDLESKNIWTRLRRELIKSFPKDTETEIDMKIKTLRNNDFEGKPLELYIPKFKDTVLRVGIQVKGENKKAYFTTEDGESLEELLKD